MITNGVLADGSWELKVFVTDLQLDRSLRVKGDVHIGGVMLRLVEDLEMAIDWSDHALWWPEKNMWLSRTRSTLDQYGVQADAILWFTPMHKMLKIQLPDLRSIDCRVDCSVKTFNAVVTICKELGIRHPEELSFAKPLEPDDLKYNYKDRKRTHANGSTTDSYLANTSTSTTSSNNSLDKSVPNCAPITPIKTSHHSHSHSDSIGTPLNSSATYRKGSLAPGSPNSTFNSLNASFSGLDLSQSMSPSQLTPDVKARSLRPKSLAEKARMNVRWLNSSMSIMEQGIREFSTLLLRYKFYSFYDLNPKLDQVRINQIYEQAKWELLNEEIDCTEDEAVMFAALQLQVNLTSASPQTDETGEEEDDIDAALNELQMTLEGPNANLSSGDITQVPELSDYLRYMRPRRFILKGFKRYWFVCKDLQLLCYKSADDRKSGIPPHHKFNLKGCEVTPDVNLQQDKFGIRLEIPEDGGMTELCLRCDKETQYAHWVAACRLASKGKTMADASYDSEVKNILNFLSLQKPAAEPAFEPSNLDVDVEDYLPHKYTRKYKGKTNRILEAQTNVKDLPLIEAKLGYIRAWQNLPWFGVHLFVVRFTNQKKDELLGVTNNRIMRMDLNTGDHIKTWRFSTMKAWNVNWEIKHMMVQFEEGNAIFSVISADCKVVHEFIGGYIFLSMRSKEANQSLNEDMFHKLTGGQD
ncbi:unc-112-related protein-like isoform X2 [Artemia franciscana]|nr:hypothetical protein QYM36_016434 [Artemia franciscana]